MARGLTLTEPRGRRARREWWCRGTRAPRSAPRRSTPRRVRAPIQHRIPNIYQSLNYIIVIPKQITLPCDTTSERHLKSEMKKSAEPHS